MLSARAIYRLLIDNEQPENPPDDPNQLDFTGSGFGSNLDDIDTKSEIHRYSQQPFRIPGSGPSDSYQRLSDKLRGRQSSKLTGRSTYIVNLGDRIVVRYHVTDVVVAYPDGKVVIQTDGWHLGGSRNSGPGWNYSPASGVTTMDRISPWLSSGWGLYSKKADNCWFWYNHATKAGDYESDLRYPFTEGDAIFPDGSLQIQAQPEEVKPKRKRKQIQ